MINIITGISILGVIVGVTTIAVVMSVLNGFQDLARALFLTIDSDVQITAKIGNNFRVSDSLLSKIQSLPEVRSANRFVEGKAVIISERKSGVIMVKGFEKNALTELGKIYEIGGRFPGNRSICVGKTVAYHYQLFMDSPVRIFGPKFIDEGLLALENPLMADFPEPPVFQVKNYFAAHRSFDESYVLLSLSDAQEVFQFQKDRVSGIDIYAAKGLTDNKLKDAIEALLKHEGISEQLQVSSLSDKYEELFRVMELEKWGSYAVLMLIIIVASLSLIGSLTMTAIEKKRDLYFLRCIGLPKNSIYQVFLFEGLIIAIVGTFLGALLGFVICTLQQSYGFVKLPSAEAFIIDSYPVKMKWQDFLAVIIGTLSVCFAASQYPAKKALELSEQR
ncbi:FtsX-like permease family protein [Chloroherpeton thalassium]|uniref:FtsX-like permease family protein n=1 Tax=Chloroherpeton thalassium TaxID=100716 RepID=UPI001B7FC831|nr:FtsX-like permease family protein [Chloroherpeton thalassium]